MTSNPQNNSSNNNNHRYRFFHPLFQPTLTHLSTRLHPLVSSTTGLPHPSFPKTILSFNLLTSDQLDELAKHFHQVYPPVPATRLYPVMMKAWVGTGVRVDTEVKRRRFGRFIGLRECESPTNESNRGPIFDVWGRG